MSVRTQCKPVVVALLSACLACPACTTTRQVLLGPQSSAAQRGQVVDRKVVVRLRSGDEIAGTLVAVDEASVTVRSTSGAIRGIASEDIEYLRTSNFSLGRTAAVIGGVLVGAVGVFYLALVHSVKTEE